MSTSIQAIKTINNKKNIVLKEQLKIMNNMKLRNMYIADSVLESYPELKIHFKIIENTNFLLFCKPC